VTENKRKRNLPKPCSSGWTGQSPGNSSPAPQLGSGNCSGQSWPLSPN